MRLRVEVPAADFEQAIDAAFAKLARDVRVPGFRPGKVPRRLLEARLGTETAREQALRDALPEYYARAVEAEHIDVIASPEIDITAGEHDGDVTFDAVVEVRPVVTLKGYDGLRVEISSPEVTDEAIDAQIDHLRERFADLEEKTAPLATGDFAEIDIKGYVHDEVIDGLSASDFLYELGSGIVVGKLDEELAGKRAGDILKFNDVLPERFAERAGQEVAFQVLVKGAKRKVLPDPSDEWASEVSEFDTIDALRDDARSRLELVGTVQAQMAVREKVLESVAGLVEIELPEALVNEEMRHRLHDFVHRLEHQGMTVPQYLEATGQTEEHLMVGLRDAASASVRADLALRAVAAAEGLEATDDDLDTEVDRLAERMGEKASKIRSDFERRGAIEAVRSDIVRSKALKLLVDRATVVDESGHAVDLALPTGQTAADLVAAEEQGGEAEPHPDTPSTHPLTDPPEEQE